MTGPEWVQEAVMESLREEMESERETRRGHDELLLRNAALSHQLELARVSSAGHDVEAARSDLSAVRRELAEVKAQLRVRESTLADGGIHPSTCGIEERAFVTLTTAVSLNGCLSSPIVTRRPSPMTSDGLCGGAVMGAV